MFLTGLLRAVLCKSLFYCSMTIFEDSWFQKSKEIIDKCDRKTKPNFWKITAKLNQNRIQQSSTFWKVLGKLWLKVDAKNGAERNLQIRSAWGLISG